MSLETYKASTISFWRDHMSQQDAETQQRLLDALDDDSRTIFEHCMAMSWVDLEASDRILAALAQVLHPGDPRGLYAMGRLQAKDNLTGLYRVMLSVTTVPFAMKQSARLWSTYHKRGQASVQRPDDENTGVITVSDYPELPEHVRRNITGFIAGILDVTRVSEVEVRERFADPGAWQWQATWS